MKNMAIAGLGLLALCLLALPATAQNTRRPLQQVAAGLKVGTTGIGVEVISPIADRVNGKISGSYYPYSHDENTDIEDIEIGLSADLKVFALSALVDWYPINKDRGLHLSGGFYYKNFKIKGDGTPLEPYTFEMGNKERVISPEKLGELKGEVQYGNHFAPYLGMGFGNAVRPGRRLGFLFEFGTMYTNSPRVDFTGSGWIRRTANQDRDIEDSVHKFKWYPVLNVGLTYQFLR